jgi:phosphate:Na+ symporter
MAYESFQSDTFADISKESAMTTLLKVCPALFFGVFLSFSMVFGQSPSAQEFKIDPYLNGLKINYLGAEEFGTHQVIVEYAVKPLEGSILEPKWQLSDAVAIQNGKAIVVDDFKLNTDYLYRIGLVDAKLQGEIDADKVSWISEVQEFHSKSVVENIFVSAKETKIKVTWTVDYSLLSDLSNYGIVVSYNTAIEEKRKEKKFAAQDWVKSDILPISTMNYEISGLKDNENYVVKVGIVNKDTGKEWYSPKQAVATERAWGIVRFLILMGALGLFIYGMKVMSDGLQQAAGSKLRNWLRAITSNRLKGVFAGVGITALVQSSSVTSVMTVSFVNAGLLTLRESIGVLLGANIGTTITAWLVLLVGFKVSIDSYSLVFIALIFPMLFISKGKSKAISMSVMGFALLFMGLGFLKASVPELDVDSALVQFFVKYKDPTVFNRIMFVFVGTLITIILQSSSTAMTLTMALVAKGILPFEIASAIILGENIGTTITATLAATVGNVFSKRAARVHMIFNVVGVFWVLLIFPYFLNFVGWLTELFFRDPWNPADPSMANEGLAILHSAFNVINVLLLVWFVPQLQKIAELTVKSKGAADEEFRLEFIGGNVVAADISIFEAKKETQKFGQITSRMNGFLKKMIGSKDKREFKKMLEKIQKYEEITDRYEIEIAEFLSKVSSGNMSDKNSEEVRALNSIANDLERIGDIYYQMSLNLARKQAEKIWFAPEQRDGLLAISVLVEKAFEKMKANFELSLEKVDLQGAQELEGAINEKRNELRNFHLQSMQEEDYNMRSGLIFNDLFSSYERIGDHIINVSEALAGKI